MPKLTDLDELPDPGDRFILGDCLGSGVCGSVYTATDTEKETFQVAIKIQQIRRDNGKLIQEELRVLQQFSDHPNLPDFYGAYKKSSKDGDEIWFVMELCEGGSITDLVNGLLAKHRRMSEEHIAYILKELIKTLVHLHEKHVMHRDIRGNNILLTRNGDVKMVDFGSARHLSSTLGKCDTRLGSPCWMAPEVATNTKDDPDDAGYGNRADVWAVGITAIELGDGYPPYHDMHPTRAMFQVVRNPPPTLYRPGNWSEVYNDFVSECLVKNPDHRPYMIELLEHPFLESIPDNNYYLTQELKSLIDDIKPADLNLRTKETSVFQNLLYRDQDTPPEKLHMEDLAALDVINEDTILSELQARLKMGTFYTFVGDVLIALNPNEEPNIYTEEHEMKYKLKSRSDNNPHIYAVADSAYQNALHHNTTQHIILSGESGSGKTINFNHLVNHLLYLGQSPNISGDRIKNGLKIIQAIVQASTPINNYSTRCIMKMEVFYGRTGKVSGASFDVYQIEKWRVSSVDMCHGNYNIFYYFYDGMENRNNLNKYTLDEGRNYRYFRIDESSTSNDGPRYNITENISKFDEIENSFQQFGFETDQIDVIWRTLAAILLLGDVRFRDSSESNKAEIENEETCNKVAELLKIDVKKFHWALTNYCIVNRETAVRRRHTCDEARDARDVLANTIYVRLVDYIINIINHKLTFGRVIFGDKYSINVFDYFGFECFKENHLPQLMINCLNEQLHYHYLQRVFAWEALEMNEEQIPFSPLNYYDNKEALDQILSKPDGLFAYIDDASKMGHSGQYIIENLKRTNKSNISLNKGYEFSIAHYTGKVTYSSKEMPDKNRDFLPPEVIETLRLSKDGAIRTFFSNKLTKTGNLSLSFDDPQIDRKKKFRWGASMSSEDELDHDQEYSQIKRMRTAVVTYKAVSLYLLKKLSIGGGSAGTHFVRCIRTDLQNNPRGFHQEVVRQQLRAMAVIDTAKARQKGFSHRVSFPEFIRRYKFLAFDFDENVEVTKDNCRLLLVRLKMEGWVIGKTKVFLKYYNEEFLSRLYETQVKKIIKIQSMLRAFLARRRVRAKLMKSGILPTNAQIQTEIMSEENAAVILQKAFRGYYVRKTYGPLIKDYNTWDENTTEFIRFYAKKWKAKSIFQILLQYRSAKYHDLFNLSQQVHLYNQKFVHSIQKLNNNIELASINEKAQVSQWLGNQKLTVWKLPFRLDEIPFFDTSYMCDPFTNLGNAMEKEESWDSPLCWRKSVSGQITNSVHLNSNCNEKISYNNKSPLRKIRASTSNLINSPYIREPLQEIDELRAVTPDSYQYNKKQETDLRNELKQKDMYGRQSLCSPKPCPPSPYNIMSPTKLSYSSLSPAKDKNIKNNNCISKPANQDFEYIKSSSPKPKIALPRRSDDDPIMELEKIGRRNNTGNESDDDPPFNFQGMLRKTQFKRESLKRSVDNICTFGLKKNIKVNNMVNGNNHKNKNITNGECNENDFFRKEIAPGIILEGIVVDV